MLRDPKLPTMFFTGLKNMLWCVRAFNGAKL